MISYKRLKQKEDIQQYLDGYNNSFEGKLAVNKIPLTLEDCMKFDNIWGIYLTIASKDILVGGYILNYYPHRSLYGQNFNLEEVGIDIEECGEITALWKNKYCPSYGLYGWTHILKQTSVFPKKIIFGTAYPAHQMFEYYMATKPKVLSAGDSKKEVAVFYYKRNQFVFNCFRGFKTRYIDKKISSAQKEFTKMLSLTSRGRW